MKGFNLKIRGHHLLCILGFNGLGYNHKFTLNLTKIVQDLEYYPDKEHVITDGFDDVCLACPHLNEGKCYRKGSKSEEDVKQHDERVLKSLGLAVKDKISLKKLKNIIFNNNQKIDLKELCKGCNWLGLGFCKKGIKQILDE